MPIHSLEKGRLAAYFALQVQEEDRGGHCGGKAACRAEGSLWLSLYGFSSDMCDHPSIASLTDRACLNAGKQAAFPSTFNIKIRPKRSSAKVPVQHKTRLSFVSPSSEIIASERQCDPTDKLWLAFCHVLCEFPTVEVAIWRCAERAWGPIKNWPCMAVTSYWLHGRCQRDCTST